MNLIKIQDIRQGMVVKHLLTDSVFTVGDIKPLETNPPRFRITEATDGNATFFSADDTFALLSGVDEKPKTKKVKVQDLRLGMMFDDPHTKNLLTVAIVTKVARNIQPSQYYYEVYFVGLGLPQVYPIDHEFDILDIKKVMSSDRAALFNDAGSAIRSLEALKHELEQSPCLVGLTISEVRDQFMSLILQYQAIQINESQQ